MGYVREVRLTVVAAVSAALCGPTLAGQMHKVAKQETVVRAVGVYEWTGDLAKPAASRLVPVTLFIDQHLEDAGVYLARPVPFVLQSGTIFELDEAGVSKGTVELAFARHLQAATVAENYDDGWFGYGTYKGIPAPKKTIARKLPPARTSGIETAAVDTDPDKPHFVNKAGQVVVPASAGGAAAPPDTAKKGDAPAGAADDPDRPKLTRKAGASDTPNTSTGTKADSSASPDTSGATPAGDPDRPTMKRRSGNDTASASQPTASTPSGSGTDASTPSADDPDRPTLKRHSTDDAKKKAKADSQASVSSAGSLNDDPDRPSLHRGKPTRAMTDADLPKLAGLPVDLKQMVAVSDAANRTVHDFTRPWEDDAEHVAVLKKMQELANAQLSAYAVSGGSAASPAAQPGSTSGAASGRPNSKLRRSSKQLPLAAAIPLQEEQLKGYLLSYGDVPTFVYQAHTAGTGADLRYVTIVAQRDAQGEPAVVLHSVTDATHLDRTPRMRLVDAVDLEASNRASLLFEMRGQASRQFGVYRVLGLQAQQIFTTGFTQ